MNIAPEILYGIGAALLGIVIAGAAIANKTRNKAKDALTEAATREQYQHPERFDRTQDEFAERAKD